MGYRLGVDLGTTFTAAAISGRGGPVMLGLGNRAMQIPSVLFLQDNGEFLIGEAAEHRAASDPSRVVREFKRRLGDPVPMMVGPSPFSAQALSAKLLAAVVAMATVRRGAPPDEVVLTYPASWGAYKRELIDQVITLANIGPTTTCPEPQAAALQYAAGADLQLGDRVAVYDLGGGTFDVCVLEKTTAGFTVLGTPEGIEQLGGVDFDEAVFQHVIEALGPAAEQLDVESPEGRASLSRLRRDCVEAKESLSDDVDTVIHVELRGGSTSVRLTRAELELRIAPTLEQTVEATARALRDADTTAEQLTAIVLVGGSSRIPLVSHLLQSRFSTPTALNTHPKHDVALGAVLFAVAAGEATVIQPRLDPGLQGAAIKRFVRRLAARPVEWIAAMSPRTRQVSSVAAAALAVAIVSVLAVLGATRDSNSVQTGSEPTPPPSSSGASPAVPAARGFFGLVVSPDGRSVYLSSLSTKTLSAIDVGTKQRRTASVGKQFLGLAVSKAGRYLYAVSSGSDTVTKVDARTLEPLKSIAVGRRPQSIVIDTNAGIGYVTNADDDRVSVLDLARDQVTGSIKVGDQPLNLALDTARQRLYVVNVKSASISMINTATKLTIGPPLRIRPNPHALVVSPSSHLLYVTHDRSKSVTVVDPEARTFRSPIELTAAASELVIGPSGRHLYAALKETDQVAVFDLETKRFGDAIVVGDEPVAIAISRDETRLFVANDRSQTLSVVDTALNKTIEAVPVSPSTPTQSNTLPRRSTSPDDTRRSTQPHSSPAGKSPTPGGPSHKNTSVSPTPTIITDPPIVTPSDPPPITLTPPPTF
jgi:YVTN family beta-propeller protein